MNKKCGFIKIEVKISQKHDDAVVVTCLLSRWHPSVDCPEKCSRPPPQYLHSLASTKGKRKKVNNGACAHMAGLRTASYAMERQEPLASE